MGNMLFAPLTSKKGPHEGLFFSGLGVCTNLLGSMYPKLYYYNRFLIVKF